LGILEKRVSGKTDTTRWTNSMACSFPWFKSLTFFYLWGHLKSAVCVTEVSDVENLERRIQNGFEVIRTKLGTFQRVRQSLLRPATACFEAQRGHRIFLLPSGGLNSETTPRKACIHTIFIFLVLWPRFNFCRFVAHISFALYTR
jgi:hypothetical protein